MNGTTTTARVVTVASVVVLLLFGSWTMAGAMQDDGMMGNGTMGNGTMGGTSWVWITAVLVLGFGALVVWIIVGQKKGPP